LTEESNKKKGTGEKGMKQIRLLKNTIQEYDWGSHTAIAELLGEPSPSQKPQAELWMGAHPKAPSQVERDGRWSSLITLVEENPTDILGKSVAEKFNNRLPYLFKVLAASKPLSIQAHPTLEQAKAGFQKENEAGIPMDASHRNYRDDMHKPEIICALTPFWGLNGFRRIDEIVSNINRFCPDGMKSEISGLESRPDSRGLKIFFESMMTLSAERKTSAIKEAVASARIGPKEDDIRKWILLLHQEYPSDIGVLSPLYLNLVSLSPGEAMFLPAGQLHAYLKGLGMELMANSDNVLRGGLTPKHVDVSELLKTLRFKGEQVEILLPRERAGGEKTYASLAQEFALSVLSIKEGGPFTSRGHRSAEILICTHGRAAIINRSSGEMLSVIKGESVIIPAAVKQYAVEGSATVYRAAVNLPKEVPESKKSA
jgi:mannose-6-phosphate isomerase